MAALSRTVWQTTCWTLLPHSSMWGPIDIRLGFIPTRPHIAGNSDRSASVALAAGRTPAATAAAAPPDDPWAVSRFHGLWVGPGQWLGGAAAPISGVLVRPKETKPAAR